MTGKICTTNDSGARNAMPSDSSSPLPAKASSSAEVDNTTFRGLIQADAQLNFQWATVLIDSLVAAGATHAVMSPGAQMVPLSLACRANPSLKVTVIIDERTAAFYALGIARATKRPTILICTSGSATGHWYPAVMESSAGLTSLILLTADRAPENQDRCSAQAIDQIHVFGRHIRASHHLPLPDGSIDSLMSLASRIYEQSLWPAPGPVHVNMPFRDPLFPPGRDKPPIPKPPKIAQSFVRPQLEDIMSVAEAISGRPGAIICGATEIDDHDGFSTAIYELARTIACPVICDPLSNLRFGCPPDGHILARADSFLRASAFADTHRPEWVLSFGGPPTSKPVLTWLQHSHAKPYIAVDSTVRWPDPLVCATGLLRSNPASFCRGLTARGNLKPAPAGWLESFAACERYIDSLSTTALDKTLWEAAIVRQLIEAAPEGAIVFSGNSMSVRDIDSFSGTSSKRLRLLANRGTNGIDGGIATILGIAATQHPTTTVAMIGDMAFSHDVGSLQWAGNLDIVLVVLNNGGGAIFDYLPTARAPEYNDFLCPPPIDIGLAARASGWRHWRATELPDFCTALKEAMNTPGPCLIEAVIDRKASVRLHNIYWKVSEGINATLRLRGPAGMVEAFGVPLEEAEVPSKTFELDNDE
ncbi:MAG TPA: 2-succinyl-5-enolpyruvyl-6-hydroxy-3-cyclohexene-1-carboxylic-acid synthase [Azospirillaceae bacterium]|nr:2-succinyl-5-enolpyruvyl-6-hydroxy-3-cyclohexene-1-carboxylic-acid synthase [Azospirillaceae bacterium]